MVTPHLWDVSSYDLPWEIFLELIIIYTRTQLCYISSQITMSLSCWMENPKYDLKILDVNAIWDAVKLRINRCMCKHGRKKLFKYYTKYQRMKYYTDFLLIFSLIEVYPFVNVFRANVWLSNYNARTLPIVNEQFCMYWRSDYSFLYNRIGSFRTSDFPQIRENFQVPIVNFFFCLSLFLIHLFSNIVLLPLIRASRYIWLFYGL